MLYKCCPHKNVNKYGIYEFKFYKNGQWLGVIIDDYIPMDEDGTKPVFSSCLDPNEVWVMLMEKAYAKLHKNYENLEGGSENYALVDMTAGAPETIDLDGQEGKAEMASGKLWDKLTKYHKLGYLLGCAQVAVGGAIEGDTGQGILQNHAYGVLDLRAVKDKQGGTAQLLRVRNPWGQGEWTGKWSDGSADWTPDIQKQLGNYKFEDDGTFWIALEDFVKQYNRFYVLRLFAEDWRASVVKGEWKGVTAGGCGNFPTWKDNVQVSLLMPGCNFSLCCLLCIIVRIQC